MHIYTIASLMVAVASLASSQQIIPTTSTDTFPGCALSCSSLLKAQTACTPPNVTQSTQISYDVCFCQAPDTQALWYTADGICMDQCNIESDRQLLQTWFMDFCRMVGRGVDPATATPSAEATSSSSSSTSAATAAASGIRLTGSASESTGSSTGSAWLSSHWKWLVMLVVLFVGFLGLALLGLWLKRRHKRRVDQEKAARPAATAEDKEKSVERAASATPDIWGPHQHMHATQGYQYSHNDTPTIVVSDVNQTTRTENKKVNSDVKVSEVGEQSITP